FIAVLIMVELIFPIEGIDNNSKLYYRIHKQYFIDSDLLPSVFRETGEGEQKSMSTDWGKYSTPNESRKRARKPEDNGIVHFISGKLRNLNLSVKHAPTNDNKAHTNVKGNDTPIEQDEELRLKLLDEIEWDIYPDEPLVSEM
ncbi:MAG: hypothetical protein ACRENZ_11755, partial [Thermodesulfobacteriota bacterium]